MPFRGSHSASAVPPTLEKRDEIMQAIRMLSAQEHEPLRRRLAEIASLRSELTEIALALAELKRACDPRLRSYVIKYSPDQPRVPAGNINGPQRTRTADFVKASPDDAEHPGWPAGTPGGKGGQFRPTDGDGGDSSIGSAAGVGTSSVIQPASSTDAPQLAQTLPPSVLFEEPPLVVRPPLPEFPKDPTVPPGPGFEWRGHPWAKPGGPEGSWYNPRTDETLRPDMNHPPPIPPHWDYQMPDGRWYRWFPDGRLELRS